MAERLTRYKLVNRRTFPRYDYHAGVTVRCSGNEHPSWESAVSQNLSLDGVQILHSKILIPGEKVHLTIPIFDSEKALVISGSVEWVAVDDLFEDSPYWIKAGIMFGDMGKSSKGTLRKLLSRRLKEPDFLTVKPANKIDFVM